MEDDLFPSVAHLRRHFEAFKAKSNLVAQGLELEIVGRWPTSLPLVERPLILLTAAEEADHADYQADPE